MKCLVFLYIWDVDSTFNIRLHAFKKDCAPFGDIIWKKLGKSKNSVEIRNENISYLSANQNKNFCRFSPTRLFISTTQQFDFFNVDIKKIMSPFCVVTIWFSAKMNKKFRNCINTASFLNECKSMQFLKFQIFKKILKRSLINRFLTCFTNNLLIPFSPS